MNKTTPGFLGSNPPNTFNRQNAMSFGNPNQNSNTQNKFTFGSTNT